MENTILTIIGSVKSEHGLVMCDNVLINKIDHHYEIQSKSHQPKYAENLIDAITSGLDIFKQKTSTVSRFDFYTDEDAYLAYRRDGYGYEPSLTLNV